MQRLNNFFKLNMIWEPVFKYNNYKIHFQISLNCLLTLGKIKLPTSPSAWFAQTEAQFILKGVTQADTKYYHVVSALDSATATRALSIITSHSETEKFNSIKTFS